MRFRVTLLIVLGVAGFAQDPDSEPPLFKAGAAEVRLDVQVAQGKRLIADLNREDFVVRDEGATQKLTYFGREAEPLTAILLLDISGSMKRYIQEMSRSSRQALGLLRKGDQVAIVVYGRRSKLHWDFSSNFEEVAGRVSSAPENPYVGSGTSTNEAVIDAAKILAKRAPAGRRAVIVVTDNGGINYQTPDELAMQELYNANAVLNAIAVGKAERPKPGPPNANPDFTPTDVFKLADLSGGEALKAEKAGDSFTEMMERVRTRYALAYSLPADVGAKAFRRVRVELSAEARKRYPNAQVRARNGYFAP